MAKLTWIKGVVPEKLPVKQVYGRGNYDFL